jgi:hypothetical protein
MDRWLFAASCLLFSADCFLRPAFAFINRKDQLHVMPRSSEHRNIENCRIAGLTPVLGFDPLDQWINDNDRQSK